MGVITFSREKGLPAVLIIAVCFTGYCYAGDIKTKGNSVTYVLEDFNSFPRLEGWNMPIPWGWASEEHENPRIKGKACVRLTWDDRAWTTSWTKGYGETAPRQEDKRWMGYVIDRFTLGVLKNIRVWIYTPKESIGLPVCFLLSDSLGNKFQSSEIIISKSGWNPETFPVSINSSLKAPIKIERLLLGGKGKAGYISIDQIEVEVTGDSRELIQCILKPNDTDFVAGPTLPVYVLNIINYAKDALENLDVYIEVIDVNTGTIILNQKKKFNVLNGEATEHITFSPDFKYGQFIKIKWQIKDTKGILSRASGEAECTRLFRNVSLSLCKPAERKYLTRWGKPGGIFWSCPYKLADETGAVWMRIVDPRWGSCEIKPGEYDFNPVLEVLKSLKDCLIDPVYASMLHTKPSFYDDSQYSFAPAYGRFNRALAKNVGNKINRYELGNETNGPNKYIYTEIARQGAAALRSVNANAMIGNAGTAGLDTGFLKMQAEKGLFEYLDELVTHPYSFGASPEAARFYDRYAEVDKLIDELGGMKFHYTTEWGWPHSIDVPEKGWFVNQETRACYIVRQFAIDAAGGILRDGLFAWDDHFGIYHKRHPYPAAASVNAYCSLTRAHEFAGWLQRTDDIWAAVFERAGMPLLMVWSSTPKSTLVINDSGSSTAKVRDMYGNLLPVQKSSERIELEFDGHPVYIEGLSENITLSAWRNSAKQANERYKYLLSQSELKGNPSWEELAQKDIPDYRQIRETLMSWQPQSPEVGYPQQAVVAQAIRLAILAARINAVESGNEKKISPAGNFDERDKRRDILGKFNSDDIDVPSLRWVLTMWEKNNDEANMLKEAGKSEFASHLEVLDEIFNKVCDVLAVKGHRVFFPIWPYLHASKENEKLIEHLTFTPGAESDIRMRLYSYASKAYKARAYLELPQDWKCEPNYWEGIIKPEQQVETVFKVTAGIIKTDKFNAVLSIEGKPQVRIPYDNFDIQLPINIESKVLDSLLPESPLMFEITNRKNESISGKLRILSGIDMPPLAYEYINNIKHGEIRQTEFKLARDVTIPPYNEWNLSANFVVNGQETIRDVTTDFACAVKVNEKPLIDGKLEEWHNAPVIHLDKKSYTDNSFGSGWSKEDLSANVYMMWDSNNFYFAAKVKDQMFQQGISGAGVFAQDSIQIAFSQSEKTMNEFSLALTPKGPQVWFYGNANKEEKKIDAATLAVKIVPGTGAAVYECAIPWSEIFGESPSHGQKIRFDILLNDDDVVHPRRYMFRFGKGIVYTKNPKDLGELTLLGNQHIKFFQKSEYSQTEATVFQEDFEEYTDGTMPDVWRSVTHLGPAPESIVRSGMGRNNSKALVLNNTVGLKPAVYRNLIRQPRDWQPGQKYELRAWVKGDGITGIGIASDLAGVQGFQYIPDWKPSNQWQLVKREIIPADGMYLIIRNETKIENLIIDDLEIASLVEP